ncbi:hypothetical protein Q5P01_009082 [Channa striata]|uniref:Uncharacterized protein n=1 Tax=Channa striata TaxID=64152 RepID=A0AA88N7W4_CHASR|nr:hypothetical protein Q5P01_009082 [Channa striata]
MGVQGAQCRDRWPLKRLLKQQGLHSERSRHRERGESAGAETRERAQPSLTGGPPPPLQPPSSLHVIHSPEANQ